MVGRGRQRLSEKWEQGMATLHGMQSHGYPNCFFMNWSQGAFTANYPHLLDEIATHISHIIKHAREKGFQTIEVAKEAEEAWVKTIIKPGGGATGVGAGAVIGGKDCTPSYRNNEGQPSPTGRQAAPYAPGSIAFFKLLADWRETGMFEGLEFGA